ncbi:hypothetical protein [Actinokineospora terrae]|uniref:Uncharacterized protein n=1 Tax=Actinokineospora terrae TaxID=155974 RepID=A0A1H9NS49_9PSEU|nr:hypothetical protein [Actinokineospora terrae]SER38776.1 hypothetical protein SAMN04487818_103105 [Actinokineospora terrae]
MAVSQHESWNLALERAREFLKAEADLGPLRATAEEKRGTFKQMAAGQDWRTRWFFGLLGGDLVMATTLRDGRRALRYARYCRNTRQAQLRSNERTLNKQINTFAKNHDSVYRELITLLRQQEGMVKKYRMMVGKITDLLKAVQSLIDLGKQEKNRFPALAEEVEHKVARVIGYRQGSFSAAVNRLPTNQQPNFAQLDRALEVPDLDPQSNLTACLTEWKSALVEARKNIKLLQRDLSRDRGRVGKAIKTRRGELKEQVLAKAGTSSAKR